MRNPIALACGLCIATAALAGDKGFDYRAGKELLEQNPGLEFDPGSLLVRFDPAAPAEWRDRARMLVGGEMIRQYTIVEGLEHITISFPLDQARQVLEALPFVMYAEPDYFVRHCVFPNDPLFGQQWGLHNSADRDIDAPEGWNVLTGSSSFVVAVLDTGTQWSHPDLSANIWTNPGETPGNGVDDDGNGYVDDVRGWDFYSNDANPDDSDGHGTHTAGTIGAVGNNGVGVAGVAWNIKLMPLRFLGPQGGSTSDAVEAIQYLKNKGVKVSNNSWGSYGGGSSLSNAISGTQSIGHLFVAAAGNDTNNNNTNPFYPASYSHANILSVASTTSSDAISSFSNYGSTSVDVGAPGSSIYNTYKGSAYASLSGTSMASPHAAGVAAMVYIKNPGFGYQQVKSAVMDNCRPISALTGKCVTGGVVNLAAALGSATSLPPSVSITTPTQNASYPQGSIISFNGAAVDPEQGNISASLIWTSNLMGQIGTGATFDRSDLSVGTHIITAKVTDATGNSDEEQRTIFVTAVSSPPAAPTSPAATSPSLGNATVTWTDAANNEDGFTIQRQVKSGSTWGGTTTAGIVGANITQFNDSPGQGLFRYRIRAFNAAGTSSWTAWRQVDTSGATIPAKPGNPTATALGGGQAEVSWGDLSGDENGFNVQRQQKIGGVWTSTQIVATTAANVTSIINTPGVGEFRYRVRSFNNAGNSAWTKWDAVTTN